MTNVYLIRHAEAEGNIYRRVHGHYDSHLTPRGRMQIDALVEHFKDIHLDGVYTSDLTRAKKTAEPLAEDHKVPLHIFKTLRECAQGVWEDVTWGDVEWIDPEQYHNYLYDPAKWNCTGCERFYPLQRRITKAVQEIAAENDGKTIAVITHGYAIRAFMCGVYGMDPSEITKLPHCDNAGVSLLKVENGQISVDYFADNKYLPEEISTFAHQNWWRMNSDKDDRNLHFTDISGASFDIYVRFLKDWYKLCGKEVTDLTVKDAMVRSAFNPKSIVIGYIGDEPVGCIDVDAEKGRINFVYLDETYRGKGLAVQLIGHAVNVCRDAGHDKMSVVLPDYLKASIAFFKADYYYIAEDDGTCVTMEKDLSI